jgi:hypothetical protein
MGFIYFISHLANGLMFSRSKISNASEPYW